jgi:hypothetical protein
VLIQDDHVPAERVCGTCGPLSDDTLPDLQGFDLCRLQVGQVDSVMVPRDVLVVVQDVEKVAWHPLFRDADRSAGTTLACTIKRYHTQELRYHPLIRPSGELTDTQIA